MRCVLSYEVALTEYTFEAPRSTSDMGISYLFHGHACTRAS